ncbi:hypothetical protein JNO63_08170 [Anaerococcus sp. mt242]|uniref:hypothetical protein n=1 Tax=Anaerococcus sp. mt242 TaxID=2661917 RepID=UPI001932F6DD|nr:hypothetical protein [Anaerococcus sp. mt242]MBM0047069.1 hypothetical protein [Anaerococcus sp. mt242]
MIKERDKARKILNVIVEYFVLNSFQNINANINIDEKATKVSIEGTINPENIDIESLKDELTNPRILAYDDYYDGLMDSDSEDELKVIGYLVDDSQVKLDGNILSIKLIRKHI